MSEQATQAPFDPFHVWLGIPPAEQPPDFYRLLGIPLFENNADVIASAADRQMAHVRSFQTGKYAQPSQELLNQIARAKVHLLHPEKKVAYDEKLKRTQQANKSSIAKADAKVDAPSASAAPPAKRKLPVALPLEPRPAPKINIIVEPHQPAVAPQSHAKRGNPVVAAAVGGLLGVVCFLIWWTARSAPEDSAANSATIASAAPPAARPGAKPVVSTPLIPPPKQPNGPAASSNGPQWEEPRETPLPKLKAEGAATDVPSLADVRSSNTATKDDAATNPPSDDAAASQLPDFDKLASAKSEPSTINPVQATALADSSSKPHADAKLVSAVLIKQTIPGREAQHAIRAQLIAVYKPGEAKSPGELAKLAREMVQAARGIETPDERYMLLSQSAELAESAGDLSLTLQIVDLLGEHFEIDACRQREQVIARFAQSARSGEHYTTLLAVSERVIKQALAAANGESALRTADIVLQACQRLPGREFRKDALARRTWTESYWQRLQEVKKASQTVASHPDDAAAQLVLGSWHCFFQDEWEQGLTHLAKGNDSGLSELAGRDLAISSTMMATLPMVSPAASSAKSTSESGVEAQVSLGDAWWDFAQRRKDADQDSLLLRAGFWYEQALQGTALSGLKRIRLEKRREELADIRTRHRARIAGNSLTVPAPSLWNNATP